MERMKNLRTPAHPLPKGLVHVDCHFLFVWRGLGLPFSGERLDAGLAAPPHAEKGCEVMESGPSLFDLGYLEREE